MKKFKETLGIKKKPTSMSQETLQCVKRDPQVCQKRHPQVSKETHKWVKRDPKVSQKRPTNVSKKIYMRDLKKETNKERPI